MGKSGSVKNWNSEKGFGFICPDDGGDDVFCHKSSLGGADGLDRGDKVSFDEAYDERKGKTHATNVTVLSGGGGGGGGRSGGGRYGEQSYGGGGGRGGGGGGGGKTGSVKNWNDEKGFGFIVQDDGGEELFCHRSGLAGAEALDRGAKVSYDETFDDRKGKMRATNVSVLGGGGYGGSRGRSRSR